MDSYGKKAGKGALIQWEKSGTLGASQDQTLFVWENPDTGNSTITTDDEEKEQNTVCFRKKAHPVNETLPQNWESTTVSDTLNSFDNCVTRTPILIVDSNGNYTDPIPIEGNGSRGSHNGNGFGKAGDPSFTLNGVEHHAVAVFENHSQDSRYNPLGDTCETVSAKYGTGGNNMPMVASSVAVRRLTPKECERLQGMPDDWSRYGVNEKGEVYELPDSARYKLQGNGIATPFWKWLMKRISAQYERTPTLGSLFDGQGSFPMIWEDINGKGTCLWSSEIEKHAIAVAKYHFPED